jgi:hypothetical protein
MNKEEELAEKLAKVTVQTIWTGITFIGRTVIYTTTYGLCLWGLVTATTDNRMNLTESILGGAAMFSVVGVLKEQLRE